ncbi:tetratricopeptide repeat protein [Desulfonatronospira sp. MSAO_Bac3]|uniref:tetratricopeptide repeat protein n=1 Tax=Desulfonatronospira sp. MSAO_Bac3 TaxID=2293857 RepID=UPI000FF2A81B|nr:tetratricopeptide repeat protein [Desulfonatronospira sp. MSAO_Bac3]RQD76660.1 MAG: tetratricopeptide repeat protein [Desulfonatronospira sp. MSAO_Bac3]
MPRLISLMLLVFLAGCAHTGADRMSLHQAELRLDLAERYLIENEPRPALEQLQQVKEASPDNPRLYFNMGLAHTSMEDWDRAARDFEKALELKPDYGEAWNNLGQVRKAQGRTQEARQAYEAALEIEEYMTPEFAYYNLASLFQEEGDLERALEYAVNSVEKNRRFVPGYDLAGSLYQELDLYDEALRIFERGAQAMPGNARLSLAYAEELVRAGRDSEAITWFEHVIEQNDDSQEAQMARDYLEALR